MSVIRWIGGFLGFITSGSPLGALAGYALGRLFEKGLDDVNEGGQGTIGAQSQARGGAKGQEGQRNSFLFSLLALSAYIIKADGRVMHSEMEVVRRFLHNNFGETAVNEGERILLNLFDYQKRVGTALFQRTIHEACEQISSNMAYSQRLQLFSFLVMIAQADGSVPQEEITALRDVATHLGLSSSDVNSILNLRDSSDNIDAAYAVLGITSSATNEEVKAAYRAMALKHHPDRVAALGDDVRRAAEKKFQEINRAKEQIYKARGM